MTSYHAPHLEPFRPGTDLDNQLATLAYTCIHNWPDQRPITPGLVRSRLRPTSPRPTLLATIRISSGHLAAAAALRYPTTDGSTGRLWGPLVHPDHQRHGLGRHLLAALAHKLQDFPGTAATGEIPSERTAATAFFERHHWAPTRPAQLLKADLPLTPAPDSLCGVFVKALSDAEPDDLAAPLAQLYAATRPEEGPAAAHHTLQRWAADERFVPDCLTFIRVDDELQAAVLVYPLAHTHPGEPAEALVGDILVSPKNPPSDPLTRAAIATALVPAVHRGARTARAIIPDTTALRCLTQLGFRRRATINYFIPPSARQDQ